MSTTEEFEITVEGHVISMRGDLDAHTAPQLDDAIEAVVADGTSDKIVLHMADVAFVDSSGLRSMIGARTGPGSERTVVLRSPSPATERLLEITGLTEHFVIEPAK